MSLSWEERPNCDIVRRGYREKGTRTLRELVRTPVGEVSCVRKLGLAYNSEVWFEY